MNWAKDDGHSYYMEDVSDCCILKIMRWEHGYLVEVTNKDDPEEQSIPLKYFYTFQDARAFFTALKRLLKA